MTCELQSTLEASRIEWPALRNHIPCMAHSIQLALGVFMRSLVVKGRTKSWEAHERDHHFGENDSIDIRKSQRRRNEGNARVNKVSAMKPGLPKIIENVHISWYFACLATDLHIAENACCIDYANTWSPKWVQSWWKSQCPDCSTSDYGWEDILKLYTGDARARLPITGIHTEVASKSIIRWIAVTLDNSRWVDDCQVCHGSIEAISILDPLDVEVAYSHISSYHYTIQWHVRLHRWRDASWGQEDD